MKKLSPNLTAHGKKVQRRMVKILRDKQAKKADKKTKNPISVKKKLSFEAKKKIFVAAGYTCHFCGRRIVRIQNCQFDHIRPHALGGPCNLENFLPCCKKCNSLRKDNTPARIRQAMHLGIWAMAQIRNQTTLGVKMANAYNGKLEKVQTKSPKHLDEKQLVLLSETVNLMDD